MSAYPADTTPAPITESTQCGVIPVPAKQYMQRGK